MSVADEWTVGKLAGGQGLCVYSGVDTNKLRGTGMGNEMAGSGDKAFVV